MRDELGNEVTPDRIAWLRRALPQWAPAERLMEAQLVLDALVAYQLSTRAALDLAVGYILACSHQGDQGAVAVLGLMESLAPEVKERLAAIRPVPRQERQEEGDR